VEPQNCPSPRWEEGVVAVTQRRMRAKARGIRFGLPKSLTPHQRQEVLQRLSEGAVQVDLARTYGASQATISRLPAPIPVEASAASPREVGVPNGNVARAPRLASSVQKVGHPAGQGARGSKAAGDQAVGCGSPNCFPTPSPRSPPSSHHQLDRHHQRASA
jgi:hypothetical protein